MEDQKLKQTVDNLISSLSTASELDIYSVKEKLQKSIKDNKIIEQEIDDLAEWNATRSRVQFEAYCNAGFSEEQSLYLLTHKRP